MQNKNPKILVVGDVMLDTYLYGTNNRVNPEASALLITMDGNSNEMPGGAGNVCSNLIALGAQVYIVGVVGNDNQGKELIHLLDKYGINTSGLIIDDKRPTTLKNRIIANGQQVCRLDTESMAPVDKRITATLRSRLNHILPEVDVIMISDYGKGVITDEVIDEIQSCGNTNILVDPPNNKVDYMKYGKVELIKCNRYEAGLASGIENDYQLAAKKILDECADTERLVVTLGKDGLLYMDKGRTYYEKPLKIESEFVEVNDLTGAGDTFFAVLGFVFGAVERGKFSTSTTLRYANKASSMVVSKVGTATVTWDDIFQDEKFKISKAKHVSKDWGFEKWIENNDMYCGKELTVHSVWSSKGKYHSHKKKDETFYVTNGVLLLDILDDKIHRLGAGDFFRIRPGINHRFKAETGFATFIEFSTHHSDADTYYHKGGIND